MRFTFGPVLFPLAVIATFSFSVHWLATRGYDRGFAWFLAVGSAVVGVIVNAAYIYDTDSRMRDLEEKVERLSNKVYGDRSK
jgi:uncharacterized membrane protein (DUF485 family)